MLFVLKFLLAAALSVCLCQTSLCFSTASTLSIEPEEPMWFDDAHIELLPEGYAVVQVELDSTGTTSFVGAVKYLNSSCFERHIFVMHAMTRRHDWHVVGNFSESTLQDFFDDFGSTISHSNGVCVVGAPKNYDTKNQITDGAVFLFKQQGQALGDYAIVQTIRGSSLRESDHANNDYFGFSVAIYDAMLLVGAPNYDESLNDHLEGVVYAFDEDFDTGKFTEYGILRPVLPMESERFGISIALSVTMNGIATALISTHYSLTNCRTLVFLRTDMTTPWINATELVHDEQGKYCLGVSLSASGLTAALVSTDSDVATKPLEGFKTVHVYQASSEDPEEWDFVTSLNEPYKETNEMQAELPSVQHQISLPEIAEGNYFTQAEIVNNGQCDGETKPEGISDTVLQLIYASSSSNPDRATSSASCHQYHNKPGNCFWAKSGDNLSIKVDSKFRIWRLGGQRYESYSTSGCYAAGSSSPYGDTAELAVTKYNEATGDWDPVSESAVPLKSWQSYKSWEKFTTWLEAGEYKFSHLAGKRLDAEWLVEHEGIVCDWAAPTLPSDDSLHHIGVLDVTDTIVIAGAARYSDLIADQSVGVFQLIDGTWQWTQSISNHATSNVSPGQCSVAFTSVSDDGNNVFIGWSSATVGNTANIQMMQTDSVPPVFVTWPQRANETHFIAPDGDRTVNLVNVTVTDDLDAAPIVICTPNLTSVFPTDATTLVTCTATDFASNVATLSFNITLATTEELLVVCPNDVVSPRSAYNEFISTAGWMHGIDIITPYSFSEVYTIHDDMVDGSNTIHVDLLAVDEFFHSASCSFVVDMKGCNVSLESNAADNTNTTWLLCPPAISQHSLRSAAVDVHNGSLALLGDTANGELISFDGDHFYNNHNSILSVVFGDFKLSQTAACTVVENEGTAANTKTTITCFLPRLSLEWTHANNLQFQVSVKSTVNGLSLSSALSVDVYHYPVSPTINAVHGCVTSGSTTIEGCSTQGGDVITIQGDDLALVTAVSVDALLCRDLTYHSDDSTIHCTLPANTGKDVNIVANQNTVASLPMPLVSYAAPRVDRITGCDSSNQEDIANASTINCPRLSSGNVTLTLFGENFGATGASVFIGSIEASVRHKLSTPHSVLYIGLPDGSGTDLALLVLQESGVFTLSPEVTVSYVGCDNGYYERGSTCDRCPNGTYTDDSVVKIACKFCDAGTYQSDMGQTLCLDCAAGKYQGSPGKDACVECERGTYTDNSTHKYFCTECSKISYAPERGMGFCLDCPANAHRDEDSVAACICNDGYYNTTFQVGGDALPTEVCAYCPEHFTCPEAGMDVTTILLEQGYWRSDMFSIDIFKCFSDQSCPGGVFTGEDDDMCADHRSGDLCVLCDPGFVASSISGPCERCMDAKWQMVLFFVAGFAGVLFCIWYVRETILNAHNDASDATALAKIALSAFQVNSIAGSFAFSWDTVFSTFTDVQSSASSFGIGTLNLSCIIENTGANATWTPIYIETFFFALSGLYVAIIAPLLMFPYYVCRYSSIVSWTAIKSQVMGALKVTVPIVLFFLHPKLTEEAMNLFHCVTVGNSLRLSAQLDQVCWEHSHMLWAMFAGVPMLVLYVVGIPATGGAFLQRHKAKVRTDHPDHDAFHAQYSFLYKGYAVDDPVKGSYAYLWEVVVSARKVLLLAVLVFFEQDPHLQSLLGLLVIAVALVLHTRTVPFRSTLLNISEFLSLFCSVLTFYLGQFTYTDDVSDSTRLFVSWMALVMNIAFLAFMFYHILKAFRAERKGKRLRVDSYRNAEEMMRASLLDMSNINDDLSDEDQFR